MEICSGGELFERIVAESEKHVPAPAFSFETSDEPCRRRCLPSAFCSLKLLPLQDGARAFDERGAATYMQQILGAMCRGADSTSFQCACRKVNAHTTVCL